MEIDAAALDRPTIGQVSDLVGLSPDTLRWYERIRAPSRSRARPGSVTCRTTSPASPSR
ncbi:MerR family DNA-binding transcriptional regulator [Micromonospora sp. NPDC050495]|uniref:MerR family DNA-binding transcriptional regulator n=1 Tax=Micromonospora sp. NPDC050495 TaxID=3154936 RepID=UPI0033FEE273